MHPKSLTKRLEKREHEGRLRTLSNRPQGIDFISNDYLGLARSESQRGILQAIIKDRGLTDAGSTGSRLLSGNSEYIEEIEQYIAEFHQAEAALIFNSGYDANVGLFSSLPTRFDTVVYDQDVHASIRDGIRISSARSYSFKHNDLGDLKKKIELAAGEIYVAVESLYSMDGSIAPLLEISKICNEHNAFLIVDEAHSIGVRGEKGEGLANSAAFARVYTYGKALGCHGAAVAGSKDLKSFLINFARSFIYTTALPGHSIAAIESGYKAIIDAHPERQKLLDLSSYAAAALKTKCSYVSPILSVIIPGNERCRAACKILEKEGIAAGAILSPTVAKGEERLRICLHSYNSEAEIELLAQVLKKNNFI
jgi:8-amino-7-oxononanoate synthase